MPEVEKRRQNRNRHANTNRKETKQSRQNGDYD